MASPTFAGIDAASVKAASSLRKINNLGNIKNLGTILTFVRQFDGWIGRISQYEAATR